MRARGIARCVAVQAAETVDESRHLLDLARTTPWIAGVVGWVDHRVGYRVGFGSVIGLGIGLDIGLDIGFGRNITFHVYFRRAQ
jgi:hypothetical protein